MRLLSITNPKSLTDLDNTISSLLMETSFSPSYLVISCLVPIMRHSVFFSFNFHFFFAIHCFKSHAKLFNADIVSSTLFIMK